MIDSNHIIVMGKDKGLIKAWTKGVPVEDSAWGQLHNLAGLPFIFKHVVAMPDAHWGMGATIGSVIATKDVVIPAAVGVDIGCGMSAVKTTLKVTDLPDLAELRAAIERAVPHGRTHNGGRGDRGAWGSIPKDVAFKWGIVEQIDDAMAGPGVGVKQAGVNKNDLPLRVGYEYIIAHHPKINRNATVGHLGTLGTGNHFIEVCVELEDDSVWLMLHSGSRGPGNRIGMYFTRRARDEMKRWHIELSDPNLAYLPRGTQLYDDYMFAVNWAQRFAKTNRELMMARVEDVLMSLGCSWSNRLEIDCHHNYIDTEHHFGENVLVTRKGAVRAREGDWGIIPGSMGERSFIVTGKGNPESFSSCSHGAGRAMSRTQARKQFTVEQHIEATKGVECKKDSTVLDETPRAYKDIKAVMEAQSDLVEIRHEIKQIICIKG